LLISPYQNHEALKNIGKEMAEKYNLIFLYKDFRPFFKASQKEAKDMQFYMQKYCGCIFSEEEKYREPLKRVFRGSHNSLKK
jgi:predicted adenine nucleotide alpha hydrolase (AANH) superfamily ATPase